MRSVLNLHTAKRATSCTTRTLMLFRSSCHGVGQIPTQMLSYLTTFLLLLVLIILPTTNTYSIVQYSLKKNVKKQSVRVCTSYPVSSYVLQIPGTTCNAMVISADILEQYSYCLVTQISSIQMNQAYIVCQLIHDETPCLARFTVLPRSTKFPISKKKKRKSAFGRTLSLTDRKHYKMGRSNSNT